MPDLIDGWLEKLRPEEGGYVNDPSDMGGETNHGITAFTARAFGYQGRMQDMTWPQACDIYRAQFVVQPGYDKVAVVDPILAQTLFDMGVNMGPAAATKRLQRALNVLNNGGVDYPDMAVDGGCGAMTVAALRAFVAKRGNDGKAVLLFMVKAQQSVSYIEIAEAKPSQERFEFGWQMQRALLRG